MKFPDGTRCFLCGRPGADSQDHVISRTFYPGELPSDALTAPSHTACNRSTSVDETRVRDHLGLREMQSGSTALFEKTKRAFARVEGAREAAAFHASLHGIEGIPGVGGVLRVDMTSLTYTLVRIAKGVHHVNSDGGILVPANVRSTTRVLRTDSAAMNAMQWFNVNRIPGVVTVASKVWGAAGRWAICFFDTEPVYVVMMYPRQRTLTCREAKALWLPWPRPRRFEIAASDDAALSVAGNMVTR